MKAFVRVDPVLDMSVRGLCVRPYPGHKKGCPNFNDPKHAYRCPPTAPRFDVYFDMSKPVYAIINTFDFAAHKVKMLASNPLWSDRQLGCVLYWQGTARKQLKAKIEKVLSHPQLVGYEATWCPEGMGVDVTATLKAVEVDLEWPPQQYTRQVALIAYPKKKPEEDSINEGSEM